MLPPLATDPGWTTTNNYASANLTDMLAHLPHMRSVASSPELLVIPSLPNGGSPFRPQRR
jgi:hypothetical protein